jgi:hypothetical protein
MAFERLNRVELAHFRECAICRYEENRPHRLHHGADDGMHSLLPGYGGGGPSQEYYRDERYYRNGAYYANRPYSGRGRSYYGNNYNPGNNYYIVNDHNEKGRPPKHKKDNKDKKHKKHHDDG